MANITFKLLDAVLDGKIIDETLLKNFGYSQKDIDAFVSSNIFKKNNDSTYSFISSNILYNYGKKCISSKDFDKSIKCFELCYEIDPYNKLALMQMIFRNIKCGEYAAALDKSVKLLAITKENDQKDTYFFILLLSHLTIIPAELSNFIGDIDLSKIILEDSLSNVDVSEENNIRTCVFNNKIPTALKRCNILREKHPDNSINILIESNLMKAALISEKKDRTKALSLAKDKNYEELHNLLLSKKHLQGSNGITLKLVEVIIDIKSTGKIPSATRVKDNHSIDDAINSNNFALALKLNKKYNAKNNIDTSNSIVTVLLEDICESINVILADHKRARDYQCMITEKIDKIESCLKYHDIEKADFYIRNLLKIIKKPEYDFLVCSYIKLDMIKGDFDFRGTIDFLRNITNENYNVNISKYLKMFFISLNNSDFDKAEVYLNIIKRLNEIQQHNINCSVLDVTLEIAKNPLSEELEDQLLSDSDQRFIDNHYNTLMANKDMILLKSMNPERAEAFVTYLKRYPQVNAFIISDQGNSRVVLKYQELSNADINIKKYIDIGNRAYKDGKYGACIDIYLVLLRYIQDPHSNIYAKLGLAYMRRFNIDKAYDYLTVANALAKVEGRMVDYDNLLLSLKGKFDSEDLKINFLMSIKEFNSNSLNNTYGVRCFEEVHSYIMSNQVDVETACNYFKLSEEETMLIKLIYAKEYYAIGAFEQGDLFVKSVEKSKNKSEKVKSLILEIRKNKLFFQNRVDGVARCRGQVIYPYKKD